ARMSSPIPLDQKTVYCVKSKAQVPLLSPNSLCDLCFLEYVPLSEDADTESVNKFISCLELLCDDFEELLHMSFDQFWCQVFLAVIVIVSETSDSLQQVLTYQFRLFPDSGSKKWG
ncbi:unnamed protein product, partial [Dicrocoelium dendriticum]